MSELTGTDTPNQSAISCPSCGSAIDASEHQAEIACSVCNAHFVLAGHLCPSCGAYHVEDLAACLACGAPMVRLCWHCQTANWTGDEVCVACGERIDLLSQLEAKAGRTTEQRLSQQMAAARQLNDAEAESSSRRMAELMAIEEARQAELRRLRARQERQERNLLKVVFVAVVIFLVVLLGYALLSAVI